MINKTIKLKFDRSAGAWLTLGSHATEPDGTVLLTSNCCCLGELEAQGKRLHAQIDEAMKQGRKKFEKPLTFR